MLDKTRLRIAMQKSGRLSDESRELLRAAASRSTCSSSA